MNVCPHFPKVSADLVFVFQSWTRLPLRLGSILQQPNGPDSFSSAVPGLFLPPLPLSLHCPPLGKSKLRWRKPVQCSAIKSEGHMVYDAHEERRECNIGCDAVSDSGVGNRTAPLPLQPATP